MAILFETHEDFNAALCALFAGMLVTAVDPGMRAAAASNYRRLYKTLTADEKKIIREVQNKMKRDHLNFDDDGE